MSVPGKIEEITVLNPVNEHTVLIVKWDPPTVPNGVITAWISAQCINHIIDRIFHPKHQE